MSTRNATAVEAVTVVPFQLDLHDRLSLALRKSGHSVNETAEYFGVSRNTVGGWTSGRINPSVQTLRLWAIWTAVPFAWLQTGENPHPGPGEGSLLPHLDSNQKPADLQPEGSDQHVYGTVFPLPGTPPRSRPAAASIDGVSSAMSEVAA